MLESSCRGLNRSASRRKNRRLLRGTETVSESTTLRRTSDVSAPPSESSPSSSWRMFLSSRLAVPAERIDRRRLIVRRSLSAISRTMLSSRSVWSESVSSESPRSESMQARTVRSSRW